MPKYETSLNILRQELTEIDLRRAELIANIRTLQAEDATAKEVPMSGNGISNHSTEEEMIHLFRELFSGRDDVFPRRFESRRMLQTKGEMREMRMPRVRSRFG